MKKLTSQDYTALDRPEVLSRLFHPRKDFGFNPEPQNTILIPVEKDVSIGSAFHLSGADHPSILFFHGNGEIVSDYDDFGEFYNQMGINFIIADYRGYGRSSGTPSVAAMMKDSHLIYDFVIDYLDKKGFTGPLTVMGRSLGSASALELAASGYDRIKNLIIESGFAYAGPLLSILGIDPLAIGFEETEGFRNIDKMRQWSKPLLIIHAEFDHIIPFSDGQALYDASITKDKTLLKIPGANHNDIFMRGLKPYMAAVKNLVNPLKL